MYINFFFKYKILIYDLVEINVGIGYDVKFYIFMDLEREFNLFNISMIVYDRFYCSILGKIFWE